ncbi:MAG TPA: ABC transporter permease [Ohtaekwangia sp.]|uniref:ABC transporter permease n=1 Tax=Ohtaekwangia sp. TaxID=2066019 RepID=UPI002F924468
MIIRNYLLISLRNILKNKVFIGINVFGMGIALACCVIAYLTFKVNHSFDSSYGNKNIYRINAVRTTANEEQHNAAIPVPLGQLLQENTGDIQAIMRYSPSQSQFSIKGESFASGLAYVDPVFFTLFETEFIAGKAEALNNPSSILLSESMSRKLFGTTDALGKTLKQLLNSGESREYIVAGLYKDLPVTSSFQNDAFVRYENYFHEYASTEDYWSNFNNVFVRVDDATRIPAVEKQLAPYTGLVNAQGLSFHIKNFYLDPFTGMAQRDAQDQTGGTLTRGTTPLPIILTLGVMALLILSIACFNLTNTLVAISTRRLKEIGLRKVMGSIKIQLVLQFIGEATLICLFSVLISLAMSDILILAWNEMWPFMKLELNILHNPDILVFLGAIVLIVGALSGAYPAFYVSKFQPAQILKGKAEIGSTSLFTRTLLVLQFAFSVIALFFSIAFYQNSIFQKNFSFGFAQNEVVVAPVNGKDEFETFRNALAQHADIVTITGTTDNLYSGKANQTIQFNGLDIRADVLQVGEDYRNTMGFQLLEGRDFNPASENDLHESVIITRDLAESAGIDHALEKSIILHDTVKVYVVGVINTVYSRGMWHEQEPVILRFAPEKNYRQIIVRTAHGKAAAVQEYMAKQWTALFPNKIYLGQPMNQLVQVAEDISKNVVTIFTFLAAVALFLSIAGLYSTVSLNLARRMKEVGVRKIFGASIGQIIWTTNLQFFFILVISSLGGCILGSKLVLVMMKLLWFYHQPANALTFVVTAGVVLWLACIMIGSKVYKAASANPILALREE